MTNNPSNEADTLYRCEDCGTTWSQPSHEFDEWQHVTCGGLVRRWMPFSSFKLDTAIREIERLRALINNPQTDDFLSAVRVEAAHQTERWSVAHDAGKGPTDWFWLLGFLAGKAVWAATHGDREKALHHCVSSAAVLLNWHAHLTGARSGMRPGIEPPKETQCP